MSDFKERAELICEEYRLVKSTVGEAIARAMANVERETLDKSVAEIAKIKDIKEDWAQVYFKKWLAAEDALELLQMQRSSLEVESNRMSLILKTLAESSTTQSNLIKLISEQRDELLIENTHFREALEMMAQPIVDVLENPDSSIDDIRQFTNEIYHAAYLLKESPQERALNEMVAESQRLGLYDEFKLRPLPADPALLAQLPNEDDLICECPEPIKVIYPGNDEVRRTVYCKKCLHELPEDKQ